MPYSGLGDTGGRDTGVKFSEPAVPVAPSKRRRLVIEIVIVLAVFPLPYVVNALAVLIQAMVHEGIPGRYSMAIPAHVGLSFLIDLLLALEPLVGAGLVVFLLWISEEGGTRSIGLDWSDPRQDLALVLPVFLLGFLLPQIGVEYLLVGLHVHGITLAAQNLPTYYAVVAMVSAVTAGVVEEIVVLGFLVRRLEQCGCRPVAVVVICVLVRISYHLYYGWGVLAILAWALASVLLYRRYRRLWPFIAVHVLWDVGSLLVTFFGVTPLLIEMVVLAPSTFVFWLMWRDRLHRRAALSQTSERWRRGS